MRVLALVVLVAALVGCTSIGSPTAVPTEEPTPTASPMSTPTPTPEPTATPPPAATVAASATPAATADPNATPTFDVQALLNAQVTIFNLSDFELSVRAVFVDTSEEGEDVEVADLTLAPEQATIRSLIGGDEEPVPYEIEFTYAAASSAGGTCTLSVSNGDDYTFVAVNDGLTISRAGDAPADPDELFLDTSSLCQAQPTPSEAP